MTEMTTADVRARIADAVNRAGYGGERIVLTRHNQRVAALVSIEDLELLEKLEDRLDTIDALAALEEAEREGAIPLEQLKTELGL